MKKRKFDKLWKLFRSPKRWIKGNMASNSKSKKEIGLHPVEPRDNDATCWCLAGAVYLTYPPAKAEKILIKLAKAIQREPDVAIDVVTTWNDQPRRTIKEVYNLCKKLNV